MMMVRTVQEEQLVESNEQDNDELDEFMTRACGEALFDLSCPNRNDTKICPSLWNLCRALITYKKWLRTIYKTKGGKDGINDTIKVDIGRYVDDEAYMKAVYKVIALLRSKNRLSESEEEAVQRLFRDNVEGLAEIAVFSGLKRKAFIALVKSHTVVKKGPVGRLHTSIVRELKPIAQRRQFGEFLSNFAAVDGDYHHVLKWHINSGDALRVENAFRFFKLLVHYGDGEDTECRSAMRKQSRMQQLNGDGDGDGDNDEHKETDDGDDVWTLNQIYVQSKLDVIHTFLAHSEFEFFVQRNAEEKKMQKDDGDDGDDDGAVVDDEKKTSSSELKQMSDERNTEKYVSVSTESSTYGFGLDHSYPFLSPKYKSIHHELTRNKLYRLDNSLFRSILVKAIKMHPIATSAECDYHLFCKYFDAQFNIARNAPIGIRHILAVIAYTDLSGFCTVYRQTYRLMPGETKEEEVTERHRELYRYARSLFEAVEFFGEWMDPKAKVLHGLDTVMLFQRFTTYFNPPISTTTSITTAQNFTKGIGLILELMSGAKPGDAANKIPKFLSVSWLSCYPNEDEKLYYGSNVHFAIRDIIEANGMKRHRKELIILNKFQKTVVNRGGAVGWDMASQSDRKRVEDLIALIGRQLANGDEQKLHFFTDFGANLFREFCERRDQIYIKDMNSLPAPIRKAMFGSGDPKKISFVPITKLFWNVKEIELSELNIDRMSSDAKRFVKAVQHIIGHSPSDTKVVKISFKSQQQSKNKESSPLRNVAQKHAASLRESGWDLKYTFNPDRSHELQFITISYVGDHMLKLSTPPRHTPQLIRRWRDACDAGDVVQLRSILQHGFHIDFLEERVDDVATNDECSAAKQKTALIRCTERRHRDAVEFLLRKGANVDAQDSAQQTALHHAAFNLDGELFSLIIDARANWMLRDRKHKTPIQIVMERIGFVARHKETDKKRRGTLAATTQNTRFRSGQQDGNHRFTAHNVAKHTRKSKTDDDAENKEHDSNVSWDSFGFLVEPVHNASRGITSDNSSNDEEDVEKPKGIRYENVDVQQVMKILDVACQADIPLDSRLLLLAVQRDWPHVIRVLCSKQGKRRPVNVD